MGWIPLALTAASAIGGALGGRKSARTTTYNDPQEYIPLRDRLIRYNMDKLGSPTSLPGGFIEGGIQNINQNADLSRQNLENSLTARGLSNSPVAASGLMNAQTTRIGQINRFQNIEAPLFEQNLRQQDYQNASGLFGMRNPAVTGPGSVAGGAFGSAAEMLAYLYGSGAFGGGGN